MSVRYCASCGAELPGAPGGHRQCAACGAHSYANPAVHAACLVAQPGGGCTLARARLLPGETVQSAALRALGDAAGDAEAQRALALYCALTDLDRGEVWLVFRLRAPAAPPAPPAGGVPPAWEAALCERYRADCAAGRLPVYTASLRSGELSLYEVCGESAGFSAPPA